MNEILQVKDLKKYFPTKSGMLHAVDGITFDLVRQRTLGIVGESGCGKSTLGRTLIRLLEPTSGQILFNGQDITAFSKIQLHNFRKSAQMIFQDPYSSINPRKTVSTTIGEPLKIHKLYTDRTAYEKRVKELMDIVGLAQRTANSYPHELDGGRRQRIGIARALALEPQLIICDEPVSALDVSIQAQILNLLMDLQDQRALTYVFITHDLSVVKHISDDILVMYLGNMAEKAPSKELFKSQLHPYTKALLSAIPIAKYNAQRERIILKGEISSPINPGPGCRFAPRCSYATEQCMTQMPKMVEATKDHFVACHHYKTINNL